ncbi:MAG TPA: arginine deiminase family protein [Allosphingosinicella sp.]
MSIWDFTSAIVRRPADSAIHGLRAGDGPAPSIAGLRAEHEAYVAALKEIGLAVEILPPLEEHPDSMFVEDPALVFPEGAIVLRPGAPTRRDEGALLEPVLRRKFETVLTLDEGSADGGDVLVTRERVYIGRSNRTDEAGARALAGLLAELGREAVIVATPPGTLHLKSDSALIDEEVILATPALAASGTFEGFEVLITPEGEESGANLVRVGDSVLLGAHWPKTADLIAARGLAPVPLPTGEIARLDAGLSCMSLRW